MSLLWKNTNLGLIGITTALTLWGLLGAHVSACTDTASFNHFCTVSLNVWGITEAGRKDVADNVAGGAFVIDALKVCTIVHFVVTFIGYMLYVANSRLVGAITIAIGHIAGWIIIGVSITETPIVGDIVDALSATDYSSTEFSYGNAIVATIVATSIQLLVFASTLTHKLVYENLFDDLLGL